MKRMLELGVVVVLSVVGTSTGWAAEKQNKPTTKSQTAVHSNSQEKSLPKPGSDTGDIIVPKPPKPVGCSAQADSATCSGYLTKSYFAATYGWKFYLTQQNDPTSTPVVAIHFPQENIDDDPWLMAAIEGSDQYVVASGQFATDSQGNQVLQMTGSGASMSVIPPGDGEGGGNGESGVEGNCKPNDWGCITTYKGYFTKYSIVSGYGWKFYITKENSTSSALVGVVYFPQEDTHQGQYDPFSLREGLEGLGQYVSATGYLMTDSQGSAVMEMGPGTEITVAKATK